MPVKYVANKKSADKSIIENVHGPVPHCVWGSEVSESLFVKEYFCFLKLEKLRLGWKWF